MIKRKTTKTNSKDKPTNTENPSIKTSFNTIESEIDESVSIEVIEAPLRLYLKVFESLISIYYRPTHEYICGVNNDNESRAYIKELIQMSTYEFYKLLINKKIKLPNKEKDKFIKNTSTFIDKESWFEGAWKHQTKTLLNSLGLDIECMGEIIPYETIDSIIRDKGN